MLQTDEIVLHLLLRIVPCGNAYLARGERFQEVARILCLTSEGEEYRQCMAEASVFMLGRSLRSFILVCNAGLLASILWEEFRDAFSEDFFKDQLEERDAEYNRVLILIDRSLSRHGSSSLLD